MTLVNKFLSNLSFLFLIFPLPLSSPLRPDLIVLFILILFLSFVPTPREPGQNIWVGFLQWIPEEFFFSCAHLLLSINNIPLAPNAKKDKQKQSEHKLKHNYCFVITVALIPLSCHGFDFFVYLCNCSAEFLSRTADNVCGAIFSAPPPFHHSQPQVEQVMHRHALMESENRTCLFHRRGKTCPNGSSSRHSSWSKGKNISTPFFSFFLFHRYKCSHPLFLCSRRVKSLQVSCDVLGFVLFKHHFYIWFQ